MTARASRVFELHLDRAVAAIRAAYRRQQDDEDEEAELRREHERLGRELVELESTEGDPLPMALLRARFDLDEDEVGFVWNAVALTIDPRFAPTAQALAGSEARRGLSANLHATIAGLTDARAHRLARRLRRSRPMIRSGLVEPAEAGSALTSNPMVASMRLVAFLAGEEQEERVGHDVRVPGELRHDGAQTAALAHLRDVLHDDASVALFVEGPLGSGRRTAIATAAAALDRRVIALDLHRLPRDGGALTEALRELRRDCVLVGAVPLVCDIDELLGGERDPGGLTRTLARFVDEHPGLVVFTSTLAGLEVSRRRSSVRIAWPLPSTAVQRQLWAAYLGDAAGADSGLDHLSIRYRLGAGGIRRAIASAQLLGKAHGATTLDMRQLVEGVRANIAEGLGGLAERIEVKQSWTDLVLEPDILDQVQSLVSRVRHAHEVYETWGFHQKVPRGIGVAALFTGPPGTGKTMVAGLIARELELELYQVDLSQVVSKWVGETEKQMARIFDAAEAGHALLLFDEADALFAKRTRVHTGARGGVGQARRLDGGSADQVDRLPVVGRPRPQLPCNRIRRPSSRKSDHLGSASMNSGAPRTSKARSTAMPTWRSTSCCSGSSGSAASPSSPPTWTSASIRR
ncbi:MAG: ATP-binding protein [Myxococcales bacterium]|nr:ATP-binding protein [Myxococcales bacterium]